jgi:hypothetical protein
MVIVIIMMMVVVEFEHNCKLFPSNICCRMVHFLRQKCSRPQRQQTWFMLPCCFGNSLKKKN